MKEYEFVSRKEYAPVRKELEEILKKVQNLVRNEFTFQFKLVGSGNKHLITREKNGNKGFDLDYNLILNPPQAADGSFWKPKYAKETIINAFKKAVENTKYDYPENSTSAITIKVKNKKESKIIYSCDFCIIFYPNDKDYSYYKYVKFNKPNNYVWENRVISKNIDKKLDWLHNNIKDYWNLIKKEYLKLKKNNDDKNKHSFQLYYEAINNLYNYYNNRGRIVTFFDSNK